MKASWRSRYSAYGTVWLSGKSRGYYWQKQNCFFFSKASRSALGFIQPSI